MGDTKISEAAVEAARQAALAGLIGLPPITIERMLAAALPHLHGEAVPVAEVERLRIELARAKVQVASMAFHRVQKLPGPLEDLRDATQHVIDCADGGDDYAYTRPMIDALTVLGILEKTGRGLWSTNLPIAQAVVSALTHPQPAALNEESEFDLGLYAWMKARGIMPDAHDGMVDMDAVVQALSDYENDLMRASDDALATTGKQQVGEVQGGVRAQFEAWAQADGLAVERNKLDDDYLFGETYVAWVTWQAAIAARQPGAQVPIGEADEPIVIVHNGHRVALIEGLPGDRNHRVVCHWNLPDGTALYDRVGASASVAWRDAVLSELSLTFIDPRTEVPAEVLRAVIDWNVRTALDPAVSSDAADLVASGAQGIDLGPVRSALQAAEGLCVCCAAVDGYSRNELHAFGLNMRQQFVDALRLIDGRDAAPGVES